MSAPLFPAILSMLPCPPTHSRARSHAILGWVFYRIDAFGLIYLNSCVTTLFLSKPSTTRKPFSLKPTLSRHFSSVPRRLLLTISQSMKGVAPVRNVRLASTRTARRASVLVPRAAAVDNDSCSLDNFQRVSVLAEALPYLQRFAGQTIVVKYGGAAMKDESLKDRVIRDLVLLSTVGRA